jgi:hypothetical protein
VDWDFATIVEALEELYPLQMGEAGDEESTHKWLDLHTVILGQREAFQSGERLTSRRPSRRTADFPL